jgi:predicted dehydrogenase
MRCLEAGVAVFCQKPLATCAADVQRIIDTACRANRLLSVDLCYRHVNGMSELKRRIAAGALGDITAIDLRFHNAYGPDKQWCFDRAAAGGGCLLDLGVHLLDLALWLQGFPSMQHVASSRFCEGRPARDADIEDQAYAQFRQDNGALVRVATSWYAHIGCEAIIEMDILGTKGGARWRNVNGSFYDFELLATHGTARELLAQGPDEWGPRALSLWARRLAYDRSFDADAFGIAASAELIDAVYAS